MKDAILELGQQQLKDVACVALLGLTRTRRGKKNRGTGEGEATKNLDRWDRWWLHNPRTSFGGYSLCYFFSLWRRNKRELSSFFSPPPLKTLKCSRGCFCRNENIVTSSTCPKCLTLRNEQLTKTERTLAPAAQFFFTLFSLLCRLFCLLNKNSGNEGLIDFVRYSV